MDPFSSIKRSNPKSHRREQKMTEESEQICENHDHWATTLNAVTPKGNPLVTDVVSDRIEQLLKMQLSERKLTSKEIEVVAAELIRTMVPNPPKPEATQ